MSIHPSQFVADPNPPVARCEGKEAFPTPQLAWCVMVSRSRSRGFRQPYRCTVCGLWHLGGRK